MSLGQRVKSSSKPSAAQVLVGLCVFFSSIGIVISTLATTIAWAIPGGIEPWRVFVISMCATYIFTIIVWAIVVIVLHEDA